eukprot:17337-Heterococcus_DN1.PRE.1
MTCVSATSRHLLSTSRARAAFVRELHTLENAYLSGVKSSHQSIQHCKNQQQAVSSVSQSTATAGCAVQR